jgi:hypothetical protein
MTDNRRPLSRPPRRPQSPGTWDGGRRAVWGKSHAGPTQALATLPNTRIWRPTDTNPHSHFGWKPIDTSCTSATLYAVSATRGPPISRANEGLRGPSNRPEVPPAAVRSPFLAPKGRMAHRLETRPTRCDHTPWKDVHRDRGRSARCADIVLRCIHVSERVRTT